MFLAAFCILTTVLVASDGSSKWDSVYGKVIYANVLYRHGIRGPTDIYPNDPNIHLTEDLWPSGLGELTKEGALQHYRLGKWLRQRYEHLLPADGRYNRSAIKVMSSDIDRCIMSATANMAGMFPDHRDERLGGMIWPPPPIHTTPKEYDNIIRLSRPCKKYDAEVEKFKRTNEYLTEMRKYEELLNFASYMSGFDISVQDPEHFSTLYITLLIEEMYGIELPRWTRDIFPDRMQDVVGHTFGIPFYTKTLQRLRVGYLLNILLTTMESKIAGSLDPPTQNITVYSGHDTTLAALLITMGVYNRLLPPFASTVLIELRMDQSHNPVVMVFFKNSTNPEKPPVLLDLPSCEEACPLSRLRELWSSLLVEDLAEWDAECGA